MYKRQDRGLCGDGEALSTLVGWINPEAIVPWLELSLLNLKHPSGDSETVEAWKPQLIISGIGL